MADARRSPPITPRCAIGNDGIRNASTKTASGSGASESTARRIAWSVAWWILMRSISSGSTDTTAHETHLRQISSCKPLALRGRAGFRVGEAVDAAIGMQDDGAGHDRAGETAPPHLVNARHRYEAVAVEAVLNVATGRNLWHLGT